MLELENDEREQDGNVVKESNKRREFTLQLDEDIVETMNELCKILHVTSDAFVEITEEWELRGLMDEIRGGDFLLLCHYFNFSCLKRETKSENDKEMKEHFRELRVQLSKMITETIRGVSEFFHCTPERFIADSLTDTIIYLLHQINRNDYEELLRYLDVSALRTSLENLQDEDE